MSADAEYDDQTGTSQMVNYVQGRKNDNSSCDVQSSESVEQDDDESVGEFFTTDLIEELADECDGDEGEIGDFKILEGAEADEFLQKGHMRFQGARRHFYQWMQEARTLLHVKMQEMLINWTYT